jgi:predicted MFS family arabinose efflux permease
MLGGRALFGGAALQVERWIGPTPVLLAMIAGLVASAALVARLRGEPPAPPARADPARAFAATLADVLRRRTTWLGMLFAALGGAAMEAAGTVAGPLLVDRGLSKEAVGRFFALPAVLAMAAGALAGGRLADALRRRPAAAGSLLALAAGVAGLGAAAREPAWAPLLVAALTLAYALFGVFTAVSYALYMDLTDARLGGTQFSAFMAAVNLCAVWSGFAVGRLAGLFDYPVALAALAAASLPALALLPLIPPTSQAARKRSRR